MRKKISVSPIIIKYQENKDIYSGYSLAVKSIVEQLLRQKFYKPASVSCRSKDVKKLEEKINRKRDEGHIYQKLEDVEDLAGVRVVLYVESDRNGFLEVLKKEFGEDNLKIEPKDKLNGYKATHIILTLDAKRCGLTEYSQYSGLKCEVQLTSILYHAWSEIEHDILYKPVGNVVELEQLGLSDLKKSFEKVMNEHIIGASVQFDIINGRYKNIDKLASALSSDFVSDVLKAKSNEEIFEFLELLGGAYYKKPNETFQVINAVLSKKPLKSIVISEMSGSKLYGKSHIDVVIKALTLLDSIRYYKSDEVLRTCFKLIKSGDLKIKKEAINIVVKFAKYDYHVLTKTKIGYSPQRRVLDFILSLNNDECVKGIEFICAAIKEIFGVDFQGYSNDKVDEITMHSGLIKPTEFLIQIRKDSINFIFNLLNKVNDDGIKLQLLRTLGEVVRMPVHIDYTKDELFRKMVSDDALLLIEQYRKLLFNSENLVVIPALTSEIDHVLYRINKSDFLKSIESEKLTEDIYSNEEYLLFVSIMGGSRKSEDNISWSDLELKKTEAIDEITESVNEKSLDAWKKKLNIIAGQIKYVDEWKFSYFKKLIQRLSQKKPDMAYAILNYSFINSEELKNPIFITFFLNGFRDVKRYDLWDKSVELIIKDGNIDLMTAIFYSFGIYRDLGQDDIRQQDFDLFFKAVNNVDHFKFLENHRNHNLTSSVLAGLVQIYNFNKIEIEKLILTELSKNNFAKDSHLRIITTAVYAGSVDCSSFSARGVKFIKSWLVNFEKLDWEAQNLLQNISKIDSEIILDIFIKRINKDVNIHLKKTYNAWDLNQYEPLPYHFNEELIKIISESDTTRGALSKLINKATPEWSIYNWHVGQLLGKIGIPARDALLILINNGDKISLNKAMYLFDQFNGVDTELCLEIVKHTEDKKILNHVESLLYSTGVVSGLYGLAEAYEEKAKNFEIYSKSKNKRINKFALRMIDHLQRSSKYERKRTFEDEQRRKIEFET